MGLDGRFKISIHALLAESDICQERQGGFYAHFYPRSPCGERQWTPLNSPALCYFYPRSPCGERHVPSRHPCPHSKNFYPRSPCGERRGWTLNINGPMTFLSTLSLRRATFCFFHGVFLLDISIHALLAESDVKVVEPGLVNKLFLSTLSLRRATTQSQKTPHFTSYFYPRSPCGERRFWT